MSDEQREPNPNWTVQPKEGQKALWMKCRARDLCEGNHAILTFEQKQEALGGICGHFRRYQCLTCAQIWDVSF